MDSLCSCGLRRPSWTSAEARTVAFMDIGTHSIRLLLVRIHPDDSSTVIAQLKQRVRLGDRAFTRQPLQPDAIERAVCVARQFAQSDTPRRAGGLMSRAASKAAG